MEHGHGVHNESSLYETQPLEKAGTVLQRPTGTGGAPECGVADVEER